MPGKQHANNFNSKNQNRKSNNSKSRWESFFINMYISLFCMYLQLCLPYWNYLQLAFGYVYEISKLKKKKELFTTSLEIRWDSLILVETVLMCKLNGRSSI